MEGIARQNIFNLLGNDSRKYHSCYITTYSFDFLFFEERVLPALKRAGIINVNLFVDGKIFQQKISDSAEINNDSKRGYSITPIEMSGAFHPKLFLAVGKKKGLVAIGSGNLTSSGINSNEEVWSAFHFAEGENGIAAPIFSKIKDYIIKLSRNCYGFNLDKLNWLSDNAPWLENLDKEADPIVNYKNEQFEVLASDADTSFYQFLLDRLPKNPKTIKIVAPFHNKSGQFIKNLLTDFSPGKIHCIIDPLFGSIPYELEKDVKVEFSDWNQLEVDSNIRRLHAKIFQFEYENQTYLVFGSANASIEACGDKTKNGSNAEVIILASSKVQTDWFSNLGINFPEIGAYDLSSYVPVQDEYQREGGYKNCLAYAEIEGSSFVLTMHNSIPEESLDIVLMDSSDNILFRNHAFIEKSTLILELPESSTKGLFKASLYKDDKRYSNFVFIHRVDLIRKTNPDTHQQRLNALINSETFSDLELDELLEYVSFNRIEKTSSSSNKNFSHPDQLDEVHIPNAVSVEEFNKNEAIIEARNNKNSDLDVLEEFLFELSQEGKAKNLDDFAESGESIAIINNDEGGISDEDFQVKTGLHRVSYAQGVKLQRKLERVINQICSKFKEHKPDHLKAWRLKEPYRKTASMEDLKSVLVGVHLILIKKNDCFYENRSIVRVRIVQRHSKRTIKVGDKVEKIETMTLLEEIEKKFQLQRFDDTENKTLDEIVYTVNENHLDRLEADLKVIPELKLTYKDESPSQLIDHHYFNTTIWGNNKNAKGVQYFILEALGSFLRLINGNEPKFNDIELFQWRRYKKRLLYQSIVIIESFQWTRETEKIRNLFELNLYYSLVNSELTLKEFEEDLNIAINKAREKGYLREIDGPRIIKEYKDYTTWIDTYEKDAKLLKQKLDFRCGQQIVFNRSLGFSLIEHASRDYRLNVTSPLGSYNSERNIFGFVDVFLGVNPCFY